MPEQTPPTPRQYVVARVIMEMLDVSPPTLDRLIAEEGFPVVYLAPRLRRFDLVDVNAWLDSRGGHVDSRWSTRTADETAA